MAADKRKAVVALAWLVNGNMPWTMGCLWGSYLPIEGGFKSEVPTIWTDEKQSQEEADPGRNSDVEKVRKEKIRDGESQKREDALSLIHI